MNTPSSILPPDVPPAVVTPLLGSDGPCTLSSAGHVSWADGSVDQSGVTTAWAPNTKVVASLQDGVNLQSPSSADLDLVGTPEISGGPTFAAITSRSYHPGGVNIFFGDGGVRFIKETINGNTWRALSSVSGSEIIAQSSIVEAPLSSGVAAFQNSLGQMAALWSAIVATDRPSRTCGAVFLGSRLNTRPCRGSYLFSATRSHPLQSGDRLPMNPSLGAPSLEIFLLGLVNFQRSCRSSGGSSTRWGMEAVPRCCFVSTRQRSAWVE